MGKVTTSIDLGEHFVEFVRSRIDEGRYKNASEVIKAGLKLLEVEEQKYYALKAAIQEGLDSEVAIDFDPIENLKKLKLKRSKGA